MPALNLAATRDALQQFDFGRLFIEDLGWSRPPARQSQVSTVDGVTFERRQVAQLSGVVVFEITTAGGEIPPAKARAALHRELAQLHHENLLIFVDRDRSQSVWYWGKRENGKVHAREHLYVRGQPGDLFLDKLSAMVVDIGELDKAGNLPVTEVVQRLKSALDVERVTKRFYQDFDAQRIDFQELIEGIPGERECRWYASVVLNRLMFIYFLQRKGFIDDGDYLYLQHKLAASGERGPDQFFAGFLKTLFFEGFAKPEAERTAEARALLGKIRYLNGGLFLQHRIELDHPEIFIPDAAFANLFALFEKYSWNLDDTPGGADNEINPAVLGYIFEKYINQKEFGAYYTRPEITDYLCEQTIYPSVLEKLRAPGIPGFAPARQFESVADLLLNLDAPLCRLLLHEVLPGVAVLDPACGSGAFLVGAMKSLINLYSAVVGKIQFLGDRALKDWLEKTRAEHRSLAYFIKKRIITDNLFGVDVMEEATEIARLRLFLALVASAQEVDDLEPLPNIDFNVLPGNSLIGLMRVDDREFNDRHAQGSLFRRSYREILDEKNRLIRTYRHAATYSDDLRALRDSIQERRAEALQTLNEILLEEFRRLGIRFEQATWDAKAGKEGKPEKRALTIEDIEALHPFHWGYEFDEIVHGRGGFDVILTNPPWDTFKPYAKEFALQHSDLVRKNLMPIEEFLREFERLLDDPEVRQAWLEYLSAFPHVSQYFRNSPQYPNQASTVNGRRVGSDINLYKLFVEQCYNLLQPEGRCGMLAPGSLYTDLGAKGLREILFAETRIDHLFGLSNERFVFEAVDHRQKFCILTFRKGGTTREFEAAFRINPREAVSKVDLDRFLRDSGEHLRLPVALLRRLALDSLSVPEFKNERDIEIADKVLRFPLLGDQLDDAWNLALGREFDMTNASALFCTEPAHHRLPLYEGKMLHQFDPWFGKPRYWIEEAAARKSLLGRQPDRGQCLDYQGHRVAFREVSNNTNERTMIAAMLPLNVFAGHTLVLTRQPDDPRVLLYLLAVANSFAFDYLIRQKVTAHVSLFSVYQTPAPRLSTGDERFHSLSRLAARLVCTTPEFDRLAGAAGLRDHRDGATGSVERGRLRAEIDGLVAHLYGLSEEEFAHILRSFPVVPEPVKVAAQNAYRDAARGLNPLNPLFLHAFRLQNFKAIRDSGIVRFTPLTVLIGENGSGKSSLVEGLETLQAIVEDGLDEAMQQWKGYEHILHHGAPQQPLKSRSGSLRFPPGTLYYAHRMNFQIDGRLRHHRQFHARLTVTMEPVDGPLFIEHERLVVTNDYEATRTADGDWSVRWKEGREEVGQLGTDESILSDWLRLVFPQWQFLRLNPERMGEPAPERRTAGRRRLAKDGRNIAEYLLEIRELDQAAFDGILETLQHILPYARDLQPSLTSELERTVYLQMTERDYKVPGWLLSTGTLRLVALLALLRHPEPPALIVVEEIENGLDPRTVQLVVEEIRRVVQSGQSQVMVTTHSPYLLDLVPLSTVVLVERVDGSPRFTRPGDQESLRDWTDRFNPGQLYTMGRLGARWGR